ncbi:hypothetical protein NUSPORA_00761 [Nucleospora cyclopteri]
MNRENQNGKYGLTGPVTLEESNKEGKEKTKELIKYLEESDFFESEEEAKTRERVLGRLDNLVKKFVEKESRQKGEGSSSGKIFTFGSYRLGVHDRGADIDALCVVPRHVSRKEFFSSFYENLKNDKNVSEISKVEEAYVPVIKLTYSEIPIDLTMARVNLPVVNKDLNLLNDAILKNMDEKCILSLNGSRVTDEMLNLVPNRDVFHTALRAVKLWGKRRFVYGNTYGYFGGIAFSISVARICQLFPNKSAFDIFSKYFEVYSLWDWPNPVVLKEVVDHHYNLKVWDPAKYPADRYHKMPVITPAYPSMCATHNVMQSTFDLIKKELQRASDILGKKSGEENHFTKVFESTDFFRKYKIFIAVEIEARESFKMWVGYVESKVRVLANKLEGMECIDAAIPFPKPFKSDKKTGEFTACFFVGIDVSKTSTKGKTIYVDGPIKEFLDFINSWQLKTAEMKINIKSSKKKEVQQFFKEFYSIK